MSAYDDEVRGYFTCEPSDLACRLARAEVNAYGQSAESTERRRLLVHIKAKLADKLFPRYGV
jgi:hypothetical protein